VSGGARSSGDRPGTPRAAPGESRTDAARRLGGRRATWRQRETPLRLRSFALVGIFVILTMHGLRVAAPLLFPVTLAVIAYLVLTPIVRAMARAWVPPALGAAIVLGGVVASAAIVTNMLYGPAADWVARAPESAQRVEYRLRTLKAPMEKLNEATKSVEKMTGMPSDPPAIAVRQTSVAEMLFSQTRSILAVAAIVLVLVYFLLVASDDIPRKIATILPRGDEDSVAEVMLRTEAEISRYLLTIALINAGLAVVVAGVMAAIGLPNPLLWGVMAGVLNFVPFVGPLASGVVMTCVALLTFDEVMRALLVPAVFFSITTVEGLGLTPWLVGRSLVMSPIAILGSLLLWSWLWGIPGALVAVPILAIVKIVSDHVESLRPISVLLGD
jgi:predicted PurR-regulated permease PerM